VRAGWLVFCRLWSGFRWLGWVGAGRLVSGRLWSGFRWLGWVGAGRLVSGRAGRGRTWPDRAGSDRARSVVDGSVVSPRDAMAGEGWTPRGIIAGNRRTACEVAVDDGSTLFDDPQRGVVAGGVSGRGLCAVRHSWSYTST